MTASTVSATPAGLGGGGSDVGVGASFGVNILLTDAVAEVKDGVRLIGTTGEFVVTATSGDTVNTTAEGGSKGGTAVGGGIAVTLRR